MYVGVKTSYPGPLYTITEAEQIIDYRRAQAAKKLISKRIYFIKQKLVGVALISIGATMPFLLDGEVTFSLLIELIGIGLIVTKQKVLKVNK